MNFGTVGNQSLLWADAGIVFKKKLYQHPLFSTEKIYAI